MPASRPVAPGSFPRAIHRLVLLVGFAVSLTALCATLAGASPADNGATGRYVVLLKDSVDRPGTVGRAQVEQRDGRIGFVYRHALKGYSALLPKDAVEGLRADPRVALVAPDHEVEAFSQAIPTGIDRTLASSNTGLDIDSADDMRVDADVAVIDTGTDYKHPDLEVVERVDCSAGTEKEAACAEGSGVDLNGHGTHVAGTIGAIDNGKGVVGVAPGARIWAVKVLGTGINYDSEIAAGVDWVTAHANQIEVVNMSLGCNCENPATAAAISGSVDEGIVYVVAAGNSNSNVSGFSPANHPDVITVSALSDFDGEAGGEAGASFCRSDFEATWGAQGDDTLAKFSNWGSGVEIAAPGVCIRSTVPGGGYAEVGWSGTSMASPHVAGAAAILASESNPKTQADVEAIRKTIVEEGNLGWEDTSGDGKQEPVLDLGDEEAFDPQPQATGAEAPGATTKVATDLTGSSATLRGAVNPHLTQATFQFEYGTTAEYGNKAPGSPGEAGLGNKDIDVDAAIGSLEPETTYHYRVVATNAKGTTYGADETFTTAEPTEWTVEASPNKSEAEGSEQGLGDVSCFSENACLAVGSYANGGGSGALAERWAGEKWSIVSTTAGTQLNDVACISATICLAVGDKAGNTGSEAWVESGGWVPLTAEVFAASSVLNGIDCVAVGEGQSCYSVGSLDNSGEDRTLTMHLNLAKMKWEAQSFTAVGENSELEAVSCNEANSCMAVGNYVESGQMHPLAMRWTGFAWFVVPVPDPEAEGEDAYLSDVSCTGEAPVVSCVAVGGNEGGESDTAVAMHWNGYEWVEEQVAAPAEGTAASLDSVSCAVGGGCVATGSATVGEASLPLAELWSGSAWIAEEAIDPSEGEGGRLAGVTCESASACLAVGEYATPGSSLTLVERREAASPAEPEAPAATTKAATGVTTSAATLRGTVDPNGASTTYQFEYGTTAGYGTKVPVSPKGIGSGTTGVEVSEEIAGLAEGTTYHFRVVATNSKGTTNGKDETFTTEEEAEEEPSEWSIESTPGKSEAEGSEQLFGDVSCFSESWCMGVGAYSNGGGSGALAELWDGKEWSLVSTTAGAQLKDVVCINGAECAAVGAKEGQIWSERWSKAGGWVKMTPPSLEASSSVLNGGSCSPFKLKYDCLGVGSYTVAGEERTLAMRWDIPTQKWTVHTTPTEGEDSVLSAVSCNEVSSCIAVGHYVESGEKRPLALHWNGTTWSAKAVPNSEAGGTDTYLSDVSCAGAAGASTRCVAVGANEGGGPQVAVAMYWDGEEWSEVVPDEPAGLEGDFSLHGVSCASVSQCSAVGEYDSGPEGSEAKTLIEEWDGSEWDVSPSPNPEGGIWSGLRGVSCGATFECLAVGLSESAVRTDPLAMRHE